MTVTQGCNCDDFRGGRIETSATITVETSEGKREKLDGTEGAMDFGVVLASQKDSARGLSVTFENEGAVSLGFADAECNGCGIGLFVDEDGEEPYEGTDFAFESEPFTKLGTAKGETKGTVKVLFAPSNVGTQKAYLRVVSSANDRPLIVIALAGRGVKPELEVCRANADGSIVPKDGKEECYPVVKPVAAKAAADAVEADGGVGDDTGAAEEIPVALVLEFGDVTHRADKGPVNESRYFVVRSSPSPLKEGGSSSFLDFEQIEFKPVRKSKYFTLNGAGKAEVESGGLLGPLGCFLPPDGAKLEKDLGIKAADLEANGLRPSRSASCAGQEGATAALFEVRLAYEWSEASDPGFTGVNTSGEVVIRTGKIMGDVSDPVVRVVFGGRLNVTAPPAPAAPKICTESPLVDIGKAELGKSTEPKDIMACSCGTADLVVDSVGLAGGKDSPFEITGVSKVQADGSGEAEPVAADEAQTLRPAVYRDADGNEAPTEGAECLRITVVYTPKSVTSDKDEVQLPSNDPVHSDAPFHITVTGGGTVPPECDLRVNPFPLVTVGNGLAGAGKVSREITLANLGELDCEVVTLTPPAKGTFVLENPPTAPFLIVPGANVQLTISFTCAVGDENKILSDTMAIAEKNDLAPRELTLEGACSAKGDCNLTLIPATNAQGLAKVNFGSVLVGKNKTLPIRVCNQPPVSGGDCVIDSFALNPGTDPAFSIVTAPKPGETLPFGSCVDGLVKFSPAKTGFPTPIGTPCSPPLCRNFVCVQSASAKNQPMACGGGLTGTPEPGWRVTVDGVGVRSVLEVIPRELDFGLVTMGCASQTDSVTVYNNGQQAFNITKIETVDPAVFKVTGTSPAASPPIPLAPGTSMQIFVRYVPSKVGPEDGKLLITTDAANAGANGVTEVPLHGEGTTETTQTDIFFQLDEPLMDILWVVDNSGSMDDEQKNLAANFGEFIKYATSTSADFQIAITVTDVDTTFDPFGGAHVPGGFWGNPKIVTSGTGNAAGALSANVKVGTMGSGTEAGLEGAYLALSEPLISDPNNNAGFLRTDAKLALIFVSDEEDQSPNPVAFYVDFFRHIHGPRNVDLLSVSIIVGLDPVTKAPNGCSGGGGNASSAVRYDDVYKQINNGIAESICSTNWGQTMSKLGIGIFNARVQYPLSRGANPASIRVFVNGVEVAKGPANGYSYDEPLNSIVFGEKAVPPQGAEIEVTYEAICIKP